MSVNIDAKLVRDLREKTGAGMMDCKKALVETNGDFEEAVDLLRKKGLAAASKKAGRIAAEGVTAVLVSENTGTVVEVNAETDFVARNDKFQDLVKEVLVAAKSSSTEEDLKSFKTQSGKTVEELITEAVATIGENITFRRFNNVSVTNGVIASYVHNAVAPSMGKISVLVAIESEGDKEALAQLGKMIAMHIAAARPSYLESKEVPADILEREKAIFKETALQSGKPLNVVEKMIEGRIRKFYEEVVLLEQEYVIEGKIKVSEVIARTEKELGAAINLKTFVRYELGEGIEKAESNFAEEVASMTKN
jgi:elongation factor Ts